MNITAKEAKEILSIRRGADIWDYSLAKLFRGIQRRGIDDLLIFTKPLMFKGKGFEQMPYFGIIPTKRGIETAKHVLSAKTRKHK